jgi:hypothetical protein
MPRGGRRIHRKAHWGWTGIERRSAWDTPDHDPSVLAETQAIFKDVFDLMRANDDRHVAAMIQLCDSTG